MWFLVDVNEQKVSWENSVMTCRRVQLHLLTILFTLNRSESLVVVLKLTFGTRVFQRQQSGCKIISIILMKYFSCWWIWCSISIPLRLPRSNQAIIFRSIVVEGESSLSASFRPPTSLSQAVAERVLAKHSSGEHWQNAKYSTLVSGGCINCNRKSIVVMLVQR